MGRYQNNNILLTIHSNYSTVLPPEYLTQSLQFIQLRVLLSFFTKREYVIGSILHTSRNKS